MVAISPRRLTRQTRTFRVLSLTLVFGLAFWELDRGGPVLRTQLPRTDLPPADFRFSQDENEGTVQEVPERDSPGFCHICVCWSVSAVKSLIRRM
ncbi:hypothetical protein AQI88_27930 [Streptomyces cellostaticus]|uniref:Uncharacterized protein n=1 Tax=Streptomyces cellostaticus TaxID=67285 RepID=A0A101NH63_9ACTN|nr:hypothetical protein AQI88_27930 [Streptomyces cellostaticus]